MTMREFNAHMDGHKLKREIQDEDNWLLGQYMLSAVSVAVEHVLVGRKAKSKYIEKPFMAQIKEQEEYAELSDEEKKRQTEQLFMKLKIMQTNFELEKNRDTVEDD